MHSIADVLYFAYSAAGLSSSLIPHCNNFYSTSQSAVCFGTCWSFCRRHMTMQIATREEGVCSIWPAEHSHPGKCWGQSLLMSITVWTIYSVQAGQTCLLFPGQLLQQQWNCISRLRVAQLSCAPPQMVQCKSEGALASFSDVLLGFVLSPGSLLLRYSRSCLQPAIPVSLCAEPSCAAFEHGFKAVKVDSSKVKATAYYMCWLGLLHS